MDFRFSKELESFRQDVKDFCEKELPPDWQMGDFFAEEMLETEADWAFYRQFKRKLGEKGWLSIAWPREYGGQESRMKYIILDEEINYYGAPGLDTGLTYGIISPTLIHHCTEEQKRKYLPPMARGETIWCEGFSEPNAGSDLALLKTRAVDKGDYFVVDGQKTWTTMGYIADWSIALFRTDPDAPKHRGLTMFIVDMNTPGIVRNPVKNLLGRVVWSETFFDGAKIPKENIVGKINQGWQIVMDTLNGERSGMWWLANSRRALDRMVNYVKQRESLAKDPMIRHKLASLAIGVEVARLFVYYVEWMREQGKNPIHEASMAKEYAAAVSVNVSEACLHILGPYGQLGKGSKWTPLGGTVLEAFLGYPPWTMAGGSPEIQKNIIATMGLGLPR